MCAEIDVMLVCFVDHEQIPVMTAPLLSEIYRMVTTVCDNGIFLDVDLEYSAWY